MPEPSSEQAIFPSQPRTPDMAKPKLSILVPEISEGTIKVRLPSGEELVTAHTPSLPENSRQLRKKALDAGYAVFEEEDTTPLADVQSSKIPYLNSGEGYYINYSTRMPERPEQIRYNRGMLLVKNGEITVVSTSHGENYYGEGKDYVRNIKDVYRVGEGKSKQSSHVDEQAPDSNYGK